MPIGRLRMFGAVGGGGVANERDDDGRCCWCWCCRWWRRLRASMCERAGRVYSLQSLVMCALAVGAFRAALLHRWQQCRRRLDGCGTDVWGNGGCGRALIGGWLTFSVSGRRLGSRRRCRRRRFGKLDDRARRRWCRRCRRSGRRRHRGWRLDAGGRRIDAGMY